MLSRRLLNRRRMLAWLEGLKGTAETGTLYLPAGAVPPGDYGLPADLVKIASASGTGSVLFIDPGHAYVVLPPFPVSDTACTRGCSPERLRAALNHDHTIGVVLVRLGAYGVGVCRGETLLASKVGTGLVHSRHRQGGSSANRFRRHREKQIEGFMTRVCDHVNEIMLPHARALDFLVYGGAWNTILSLQKQCRFLGQLKAVTLPPLLDIPDPRQPVLEAAVERVWSSTVLEWEWEEG